MLARSLPSPQVNLAPLLPARVLAAFAAANVSAEFHITPPAWGDEPTEAPGPDALAHVLGAGTSRHRGKGGRAAVELPRSPLPRCGLFAGPRGAEASELGPCRPRPLDQADDRGGRRRSCSAWT